MHKKCLYLHWWFKAALKSELVPLAGTLPMEFSWAGTPLAALVGYEAHFAESASLGWISCRLCSSIPCPYLGKKVQKSSGWKEFQLVSVSVIILLPFQAQMEVGGSSTARAGSALCHCSLCVPLLLFWHHWFCVLLVVFCQAEILTRVAERGGSSIRISEISDFIRFRRNRWNEPVHYLFIARFNEVCSLNRFNVLDPNLPFAFWGCTQIRDVVIMDIFKELHCIKLMETL